MVKTILFNVLAVCCLLTTVVGQTKGNTISDMEKSLMSVQAKQVEFDRKVQRLSKTTDKNARNIQSLVQRNEALCESIDSLKSICDSLEKTQVADKMDFNGKMQNTNNALNTNKSLLESRTLWGCVAIVVILAVLFLLYYLLTKRIKTGTSSIDEVRKAQDTLLSAQTKMQEESVKLDNKLLELAEKQMQIAPAMTTNNTPDHSLALKVADEIVRIEMNMSRMDASIKGYKQLAKAVQRIKDNFNANGYEIVDMLGKSYNAGMRAAVTFVTDESLESGQQIITKIIKPQINYNQQMIQAAQIEVSQSE